MTEERRGRREQSMGGRGGAADGVQPSLARLRGLRALTCNSPASLSQRCLPRAKNSSSDASSIYPFLPKQHILSGALTAGWHARHAKAMQATRRSPASR